MIFLPGMEQIWAALPEARMVGGAVRDMLAGHKVADVDFAVALPPDEVMARAKAAGLKFVPTGLAHGTVTLIAAGRGFEVTSLRKDLETDGRHAKIAFTDNWQEDAARRDFTINAMSCGQDGRVYDYFGGRADLSSGIVRFVGDAGQRIREDYLRILRFFRFFARYGQGGADAKAIAAIKAEHQGLSGLSAERIWSELKKIMQAPAPFAAIEQMQKTGVLEAVLPASRLERLADLLARGAPPDPLLRLTALTDEDFSQRLKLSSIEAETIKAGRAPFTLKPKDDDAQLRRALADTKREMLIAQSWLYGGGDVAWENLRARLEALEAPVFPLQGRDFLALGLKPGAQLGEHLAALQAWWREGGCVADKTACLEEFNKSFTKLKTEEIIKEF